MGVVDRVMKQGKGKMSKDTQEMYMIKAAIISAISEVAQDCSCKAVFAALVDCTIDAGIIMAGREKTAEAVCVAVNARLLNSDMKQVK